MWMMLRYLIFGSDTFKKVRVYPILLQKVPVQKYRDTKGPAMNLPLISLHN